MSSYEVEVIKQEIGIPPAEYSLRTEAGVHPISQLVATILEGNPGSHGLYKVTFSAETLAALQSGDATLMQSLEGNRAIAVRLNGKIKELGTVTKPSFDVVHACFATASLVTGQYFLMRIDQKLEVILADVHKIQEWLDSTEKASLDDAISYLQGCLTSRHQDSYMEKNAPEVLYHRTKCMEIAGRNLNILESKLTPLQLSEASEPNKFEGRKSANIRGWIDNKVSKVISSRRKDSLISETREFANVMTRGLLALQMVFYLEAILTQEPTSIIAGQACSMVERYKTTRRGYTKILERRKRSQWVIGDMLLRTKNAKNCRKSWTLSLIL